MINNPGDFMMAAAIAANAAYLARLDENTRLTDGALEAIAKRAWVSACCLLATMPASIKQDIGADAGHLEEDLARTAHGY